MQRGEGLAVLINAIAGPKSCGKELTMARFNVLAYIDELMDMGMSEEDAYNECNSRLQADKLNQEADENYDEEADEEYRQWLEEQEREEILRYEEAQEEHERYEAEAEQELWGDM